MSNTSPHSEGWNKAPFLLVDDVIATAHFYRDKLGFQFDRFWGDPPGFCMVGRGGITIMLKQTESPGVMRPNNVAEDEGHWDAYIWVDAADPLFAEFQAKGVTIARAICDQPYGCRDFDVLDCNGYRLCFGQDLG